MTAAAGAAAAAMAPHPELAPIAARLDGELIEAFDAAAKRTLAEVVDTRERTTYHAYLELLLAWIDHARRRTLGEPEIRAVELLTRQLRTWRTAAPPRRFTIEDLNWRVEFARLAGARSTGYRNPHVIHNLLHQWLLATAPVSSMGVPERVRELLAFAMRFSSRATKLLRYSADQLEFEIPMGTHKASFVLRPHAVSVEWTEPPDAPGTDIARILGYEHIFARYAAWYPHLRFDVHRERVVGTWTLFATVTDAGGALLSFDAMRDIIYMTRFLFDASYDFSYVENSAVDGLSRALAAPQWRPIFEALVEYRAVYDDLDQYVHLHTQAMSTALHGIARDREIRALLVAVHAEGWPRALGRIAGLERSLADTRNPERWCKRYEQLRQVTLLAAAAWPAEALDELVARPSHAPGTSLLAASVLHRLDLRPQIAEALRGPPSLDGFFGLVLTHMPVLACTHDNAAEITHLLVARPKAFRRAKHFVAARCAAALPPALLDELLGDLDFVPFGAGDRAEAILAAALTRLGRGARFDLRRGIDWTQLEGN